MSEFLKLSAQLSPDSFAIDETSSTVKILAKSSSW